MRKETRFSAKCERFIKLMVQLLPIIVILVLLCITKFEYNFNYNADVIANEDFYFDVGVNTDNDYFWSNLVEDFGYMVNDTMTYFIPSNLGQYINTFLENYLLGVFDSNVFYFIAYYVAYLVIIEILWLLKNVLIFLPKIGNYFINKWSGD